MNDSNIIHIVQYVYIASSRAQSQLNPNRNLKIIIIFVKNSKIKFLRHSQFCFSSFFFLFFLDSIFFLLCSSLHQYSHLFGCACRNTRHSISSIYFIVTVFLSHFLLFCLFFFVSFSSRRNILMYVLISV